MYSIIIPVYNRPDEINELLESLASMAYFPDFEVIIVEDGSTVTCEHLLERYKETFTLKYFYKENTGPGDSRNFGMQKATGDYFLIFDSDCVLSHTYLLNLDKAFEKKFYHCFGGPDAADESFTDVQKAINFSMTSWLTTGGLRGKSEQLQKFQPRSFNMGLSREAFEKTGGFSNIHPGEDPELVFKLWQLGYETALIKEAIVFHKRRINWSKFFMQMNKFGKVRPILNQKYPEYSKLTFWLPTLFITGFFIALFFVFIEIYFPFLTFILYFSLLFITSFNQNQKIKIAIFSIFSSFIQFLAYGMGFLKSQIKLNILKQKPELAFPELFFKKTIK